MKKRVLLPRYSIDIGVRGQVTIFIIIAILFIAVIASFFLLKGEAKPAENVTVETNDIERVEEFVENCILKGIENGMDKGNFKDTDSFENFLNYDTVKCIDGFSEFRDLEIEEGHFVSDVDLNDDEDALDIHVSYPLKISSGGKKNEIDNFVFEQPLVSTLDLELSSDKTEREELLISPDKKLYLKIPKETRFLDKNGDVVDKISIELDSKENFKSLYNHVAGKKVYNLKPIGATFSNSLEIRYNYNDIDLGGYISEGDIEASYYIDNPDDYVYWKKLDGGSVDAEENMISVSIDSFGHFAITSPDEANLKPSDYSFVSSSDNLDFFIKDETTCSDGIVNVFSPTTWCSVDCFTNSKCPEGTVNCDCEGECSTPGGKRNCPSSGPYTCKKVIANDGTDGFFSLASYDGNLYAGAFGYGQSENSMLFSLGKGRVVSGIEGIKESVCVIREFNGELYANTESDGKIYKSSDGENWEEVYEAPFGMGVGCALSVMDNYIYAVSADYVGHKSVIIRSKDGEDWEKVNENDVYLRDLVTYDDKIYGFGIESSGLSKILTSSNGEDWKEESFDARLFRSSVINGELWVGSGTSLGGSGKGAIWRLDDDFDKVYSYNKAGSYVSYVESWKGNLFAGVSQGWKDASGPTELLFSQDNGGSWETACLISDAAIWDIEVYEDRLFIAGWDYLEGGSVYEVLLVNPYGGGAGKGDETFVWKPVSESRAGKAGIVLPASYPSDCDVFVNGERHTEAAGRNEEVGNRPVYFMGKTGSDYGDNCLIEVDCGKLKRSTTKQCDAKSYGW